MSSAKMSSRRVLLVLGSSGNVGKHVVARLQQLSAESQPGDTEILIVGCSRSSVGTRTPASLAEAVASPDGVAKLETVQCDLAELESVRASIASAKPDAIFLCLPQSFDPQAMTACSNAVVDAAVDVGTQRLVRISSFGIDGPYAQGPLGEAHKACEAYCRSKGICLSSVRPTSFHTNFEKYDVESISSEGCFRSPLGTEARVNWVHCADIGHVAASLMLKSGESVPFEVVDVTGPPSSTLSAPEMALLLTEELGRPIRYEEVQAPPFPAYEALWTFLRAGGFDSVSIASEELMGHPATDFREVVRVLNDKLQPK